MSEKGFKANPMTEAEYLEWCKKWGFAPHTTYVGGVPVKWEHGHAGSAVKAEIARQFGRFI